MNRFALTIFCFLSFSHAQTIASNTTTDTNSTQCPAPNIPGFFYQQNCKLLCRTTHWTDILVFYLGNYAAHAATVVSNPGQSSVATLVAIVTALLFPGGGVRSGVDAIMSLAKRGKTDLEIAARAGAICAVVKVEEPRETEVRADRDEGNNSEHVDPEQPEILPVSSSKTREPSDPARTPLEASKELPKNRSTRVHGSVSLPKGYALMIVPRRSTFSDERTFSTGSGGKRNGNSGTPVLPLTSTETNRTTLSCSYNIVKIIISVVQLLFSISTLYRTRGDQLARYGYAAFGLTTIPYAWMSLVNLIGNAVCPQYDTVYIVASSGLDHLRERLEHGSEDEQQRFGVTGEVGRLTEEADAKLAAACDKLMNQKTVSFRGLTFIEALNLGFKFLVPQGPAALPTTLPVLAAAIPIAVVGGLTRFQLGDSALYQRVWVMLWLVMGYSFASPLQSPSVLEGRPLVRLDAQHPFVLRRNSQGWSLVYVTALYAAIAIGGYVVVAQMLMEFGVCSINQAVG